MLLREKFIKVIYRQTTEYIPKNISLSRFQRMRFVSYYGHDDYFSEWQVPTRMVDLPFSRTTNDFCMWHDTLSSRTIVDDWGIGHEKSDDDNNFERLVHPLEKADSVAAIERYPFPQPIRPQDVIQTKQKVDHLKQKGLCPVIPVAQVGGTIFWPAYKLRGMENFLCDMILDEEMVRVLIKKITDICTMQAQLASCCKPDIIHLADDLGTQLSTYMSPELFRKWIKPGLASVIEAAKSACPDVRVSFHSDGAIQSLIPDLVEIGIDILNPIQPECMDLFEIKAKYGDQLVLYGCVGTQTTMPFDSAADVRRVTLDYCEKIGEHGGLWIAPTHVIEPEVPWDNILAFVIAANEYA